MQPRLPFVELTTGANPIGTVIWLHGLGADGWDFVPLVKELPLPEGMALRFIFPHAPHMPVTINGGHVMPAWYDIKLVDIVREPDMQGIRQSHAMIEELIAYENARGVATNRIVLAGFSQGGAITLHTGTRHAQRLAGLIALSTYLADSPSLVNEASAANRDVPILMVHGTRDPIVPHARGAESAKTLRDAGYNVRFDEYPMEHSVCMEEIESIAAYLHRWLGAGVASGQPKSSIILT
jgi:phospholipase/carboxylesterase